MSRLRRALGDAALVTGTSAGYTLEVDPSAVDALEVLRLAEQASAFRRAGDPAAALETCTTALAMFRGEILSGAGEGDWLTPHRVRLAEVRLGLVEAQLAARLDLGASGEVIGELEALVSVHPLHEGLWALLIAALYRDGRQADALATYQRVRHQLADELGLDPGRSCSNSSNRSCSTTCPSASPIAPDDRSTRTRRPGTCRRCRRSSSVARPKWPRCPICSPPGGSSRSSAQAVSARRQLAIAIGRRLRSLDGRRAQRRLVGPTRDRDNGQRSDRHVGRGAAM